MHAYQTTPPLIFILPHYFAHQNQKTDCKVIQKLLIFQKIFPAPPILPSQNGPQNYNQSLNYPNPFLFFPSPSKTDCKVITINFNSQNIFTTPQLGLQNYNIPLLSPKKFSLFSHLNPNNSQISSITSS